MIEERTAEIAALHARVTAVIEPTNGHHPETAPSPAEPMIPDDHALLDRARAARNGAKFAALWAGDTSAHGGDDSSADLALCSHLAFWTARAAPRMDRLFRQSGLMREKWDKRRGSMTYGERTIDAARKACGDTYSGARIDTGADPSNGHTARPEAEAAGTQQPDGPVLVRLSDVAPEPVTWLWRDRIPRGKLTLIIGEPGEGKTYLLSDIKARLTTCRLRRSPETPGVCSSEVTHRG